MVHCFSFFSVVYVAPGIVIQRNHQQRVIIIKNRIQYVFVLEYSHTSDANEVLKQVTGKRFDRERKKGYNSPFK